LINVAICDYTYVQATDGQQRKEYKMPFLTLEQFRKSAREVTPQELAEHAEYTVEDMHGVASGLIFADGCYAFKYDDGTYYTVIFQDMPSGSLEHVTARLYEDFYLDECNDDWSRFVEGYVADVRETLTDEQLKKVTENRVSEHDFYDANQSTCDVFEEVFGREIDFDNEDEMTSINNALSVAYLRLRSNLGKK
jgi:hypothetical protein